MIMKKLVLFIFISLLSNSIISQTDTLYFIKDKKVNCKITEINDFEIKYKMADLPDGPTYVVYKNRVTKYVLASGHSEVVVPVEPKPNQRMISGGKSALKILPLSYFMDHISLTYERVIQLGTNLELEAGLVNNSMFGRKSFVYDGTLYDSDPPLYYGFYFKPGIKVLLGEGFRANSNDPVHPLKGHYVRLDLAFSYLTYPNLTERDFNSYYQNTSLPIFNVRSIGYGALFNYGRQFVFGQRITFEYYLGLGFAWQENKCLNPVVNSYGGSYGLGVRNMAQISRYGAFYRYPNAGICGSVGLKLGYVFVKKKKKSDEVKK